MAHRLRAALDDIFAGAASSARCAQSSGLRATSRPRCKGPRPAIRPALRRGRSEPCSAAPLHYAAISLATEVPAAYHSRPHRLAAPVQSIRRGCSAAKLAACGLPITLGCPSHVCMHACASSSACLDHGWQAIAQARTLCRALLPRTVPGLLRPPLRPHAAGHPSIRALTLPAQPAHAEPLHCTARNVGHADETSAIGTERGP